MQKRGQITVFIILGIIILVGVVLFLALRGEKEKQAVEGEFEAPTDSSSIKTFVESCLKKTAEDAVVFVGFQGGYYVVPENSFVYDNLVIPYYFSMGQKLMPLVDTVQEQISLYINDNLNGCLDSFSNFENRGLDVEEQAPNTSTTITDDKIILDLNYPLAIKQGEKEIELSEFNTEIRSELMKSLDLAAEYIELQMTLPDEVLLTVWHDILIVNNMVGSVYYKGNNSVIFAGINSGWIVRNSPYNFLFAVKYDWEFEEGLPELIIDPIPPQILKVGEPFSYQLSGTGNNLRYSADTNLFEVTPAGLIEFTPVEDQAGLYYILITAEDDQGQKEFEMLEMHIVEVNE